jgi:hypothetical protein
MNSNHSRPLRFPRLSDCATARNHNLCSSTDNFRETATTARFLALLPPRSHSFNPQRRRSLSCPNGPRMYCAPCTIRVRTSYRHVEFNGNRISAPQQRLRSQTAQSTIPKCRDRKVRVAPQGDGTNNRESRKAMRKTRSTQTQKAI